MKRTRHRPESQILAKLVSHLHSNTVKQGCLKCIVDESEYQITLGKSEGISRHDCNVTIHGIRSGNHESSVSSLSRKLNGSSSAL